jgi:hypothetical protein
VTFAEAARLVPLGVHRATVARWATPGVRGVQLECIIIAGRTVTSVEALDRFLAACRDQRWAGIARGGWYEDAISITERAEQLGLLAPRSAHPAVTQAKDAVTPPPSPQRSVRRSSKRPRNPHKTPRKAQRRADRD